VGGKVVGSGRGKGGKRGRAHLRCADAFVDPARLGVGMDHRGECGKQRGRHLRRQGWRGGERKGLAEEKRGGLG
jgi:hypothetical protein